jgi:cytochrome d ubiquinol oxidase subunit I
MHTPQGFSMIDGRAFANSWWAIIFNPSMPYRLLHMMVASFLTVSFLLAGLSAYRYLRGCRAKANNAVLKLALTSAMILTPVQIILGDLHGLNTLEHQPAKLAAMEGIWEGGKGVPAVLIGIPDPKTRTNLYEVSIPKLASLYLTHDWDGEVKGLNDFGDKVPPVAPVFFAFRVMVGIGLLMLLTSWLGRWQLRGGRELPRWMAKGLVLMTFSGWIGVLSGWYVTEIGRQPYLVTGVLTTAEAVTKLPTGMVLSSLLAYLAVYVGLLLAYIWVVFYLTRKVDDKSISKRNIIPSSASATNAVGAQ